METLKPVLTILLILSIFTFSSCSWTTVEEVPDKGENSFTCRINGEKFIPRVTHDIRNIKGPIIDPLQAFINGNTFSLSAESNNLSISLYIKELNGKGNYEILQSLLGYPRTGSDTINNRCFLIYNEDSNTAYRSSGPPPSGEINITSLSNNNRLIEGTFNVTLYKQNERGEGLILSDSIKITNGKFNLNLNTLNQN